MAIRREAPVVHHQINPVTGKETKPFSGSVGIVDFPGTQGGKRSIEEVREYIKNMARRKGFRFSGGTVETAFQLKISGTAKFLLGIAFLNEFGAFCKMQLNNEVLFEDCDAGFFTLGKTNQDYYAINRPLSGQDDLTLFITGDAAYENEPFIIFYI